MIDLRRKFRARSEEDEMALQTLNAHPRFSHATMMWVGIGSAALGAGASIYGASQQRTANNRAQDTNARLQQQQNDQAWANWLMTRGVAPTSPVAAGVMPTAGNYRAVNTRLPIWASVSPRTSAVQGAPFLIRKPGA
jgi:hypothetical protein